jgi:hypothetical protein
LLYSSEKIFNFFFIRRRKDGVLPNCEAVLPVEICQTYGRIRPRGEGMKKAVLALILTMAVASQAFSDEIDEVRELLAKERGGDILFLSKINLGISGGDNWIADRSDGWTYIYTINDDKEVKEAGGISTATPIEIQYWDKNSQSFTNFDDNIVQCIPGTHIGRKATSFGDYNGDGIDEIFNINTAIQLSCTISGYNNDNGKRVFFLNESFEPISPKGPAPILFVNYEGTDGILIHTIDRWEQYVWVFFAWEERSKKFELYMTIDADEMDWSMFTIIRNEDEFKKSASTAFNNRNESVDGENGFRFYETSPFSPSDDGKDSRFIFYVAIAVGVIVLALALFFVVRRKKG